MPTVTNGTFQAARDGGRRKASPRITGHRHPQTDVRITSKANHGSRRTPKVATDSSRSSVPNLCCLPCLPRLKVPKEEMPNIAGRFNEFFQRQLSLGTPSTSSEQPPSERRRKIGRSTSVRETPHVSVAAPKTSKEAPVTKAPLGFINKYLDGQLKKSHPDIICGKTCYDLPVKEIDKLYTNIVAAFTGPGLGLASIDSSKKGSAFKPPVDDVDFIDEDFDDSEYYQESPKQNRTPTKSKSPPPIANSLPSTNLFSFLTKHHEQQVASTAKNESPNSSSSRNSSSNSHQESNAPEADPTIAGVSDWQNPSPSFAYGISSSLYENHPTLHQRAGDPVADSFGICVRDNSAILAMADGVNWGVKASLASKCAVNGCIDYLNEALYHKAARIENTMDIFVCLLRSFSAAHDLILKEQGKLTTLTVAVVAQLKSSDRFIVCTCNVGDSLAYVYSKKYGVREITQGSHDIYSMRNMKDALGALGPVDGQNPELNNLTVAMTIVDKGDIVFLTSDGVSDNFDPVVGKFAIPKTKESEDHKVLVDEPDASPIKVNNSTPSKRAEQVRLNRSNSNPDRDSAHRPSPNPGLPVVSAQQRHELTLLRMEDILKNGMGDNGDRSALNARKLCENLIEFCNSLTMAKRRVLEDPELYKDEIEFGQAEQKHRRKRVGRRLVTLPGKLDHASVVAYKVGFRGDMAGKKFDSERKEGRKLSKDSYNKMYDLKLRASLATWGGSQDDFVLVTPKSPVV